MPPDRTVNERSPFLTRKDSVAGELRRLVLFRISRGTYAVGTQLPSTRDLSQEFGVNHNTVNAVYKQLEYEGIVQSKHGKGTFVVGRPASGDSPSPETTVANLIQSAVRQAKLFGVDKASVSDMFVRSLGQVYEKSPRQVAFVECTDYDSTKFAQDLETQLGVGVQPVVLSAVLQDPHRVARTYRFVATTLFHLGELEHLLNGRLQERVIGVYLTPSADFVLRLSRIASNQKVAVVSLNERALREVTNVVATYSDAELLPGVIDSANLTQVLAQADLLVVTPSCEASVTALKKPERVIVTEFVIDPQSVNYLRGRLAESKAIARPATMRSAE